MYEVSGEEPFGFSVGIDRKEVFAYLMHTAFGRLKGVVRFSISAVFFILAVVTRGMFDIWFTLILVALGLLNPVVTPLLFLLRVSAFDPQKSKYTYFFERQGISISLNQETKVLPWDAVFFVEKTSSLVIISETNAKAFIIPRKQIPAGHEEKFFSLLQASLPKEKFRF